MLNVMFGDGTSYRWACHSLVKECGFEAGCSARISDAVTIPVEVR